MYNFDNKGADYVKNIVNKLCDELNKKNIDWNSLEGFVSSLGESINLYDDEKTILSEAYMSHQKDGRVNIRLTEIFLKYGFDVRANDGKMVRVA